MYKASMGSQLTIRKENTPTSEEIQFVSEQLREGHLKGEYKDEEKTITWEANIQITHTAS